MTDDRPLLGAAMIVKNEAHHLRRCLPSLHGLCDEIVLVDTGSEDDSVEVALSFGATVLHRPWDGDFSAARNLALDHLRSEWVLYIDADEEVQPVDPEPVRQTLANSEGVASYLVKFAARVGWTPYWEYRVWRHRPDVRYWGKIHETMLPDLRRIVREEGQRFERIDLFLQHYGYEGDQTAKHHRNLPILRQQVKDSPTRVYLWNHIGRILEDLGRRDEAEEAFLRGVELVRQYGLVEPVDILAHGSLALFQLRHGGDARSTIDEGLTLDPDHHTLWYADAAERMARSDWAGAEVTLRRLIEFADRDLDHTVLAYSRDLFTRLPMAMLADCLFEQQRFTEAADMYEHAGRYGAHELEMRSKAAVCRTLARTSGSDDDSTRAE